MKLMCGQQALRSSSSPATSARNPSLLRSRIGCHLLWLGWFGRPHLFKLSRNRCRKLLSTIMKWQRQGCNLSTLLYRQRMWFLLRTNWVAQFPHIVTLTQQQLVKVEVEVCQTLLTCLRVQGFPAYVFHRTLPINAFIIDSVLFCHKTYSSLAKNLTLGRANGRKMTIAFYFFCSLNGTQVQMNLRGFLIGK